MTSAKQRRIDAYARNGFDLTGHHQKWVDLVEYTEYNPVTGEIVATGLMSRGAIEQLSGDGRAYLLQPSQLGVHYVDLSGARPRLKVRASCPAVVAEQTISRLPVPCSVEVCDPVGDVTTIKCEATAITLEFEYPGSYTVIVRSVPYMDGIFTIEV